MNLALDLPQYERLEDDENGGNYALEWDTYRALCRSALAIIERHPSQLMAIYRLTDSTGEVAGLGLDIFIESLCLSLQITDSELQMYACELDNVKYRTLAVSDNCDESWRVLVKIARKTIKAHA
jgi:hypothetical protein